MRRYHEIRILSHDDVVACAPTMAQLLEAVRTVYAMDADGGVDVPTKIGVSPPHPGSFLHAMPARVGPLDVQGVKWVSYYPDNQVAEDSHALILLNDSASGAPVAMLDGMWITYARTAACVAVLVARLAASREFAVGLIGAGELSRWSLRAMAATGAPISEVFVSSRTRASGDKLADELHDDGLTVNVVNSSEEVLGAAQVVISSTSVHGRPIIDVPADAAARTIVPLEGPTVCTTGTLQWADRVVSDDYDRIACQVPPDILSELARRHVTADDLLRGEDDPAAGGDADRQLLFVTGKASFDVVVANQVLQTALAHGLGTTVRLN